MLKNQYFPAPQAFAATAQADWRGLSAATANSLTDSWLYEGPAPGFVALHKPLKSLNLLFREPGGAGNDVDGDALVF